jgi:hypothetical protein
MIFDWLHIAALFRVEFSGRGELSERQQKVIDSDLFYLQILLITC